MAMHAAGAFAGGLGWVLDKPQIDGIGEGLALGGVAGQRAIVFDDRGTFFVAIDPVLGRPLGR